MNATVTTLPAPGSTSLPAPLAGDPTIDITTDAFAKRLSNLLTDKRARNGRSVRSIARSADGLFSVRQLRAMEAGEHPLTEAIAREVAFLYGADLGDILPERLPLMIRPGGVLSTGGVATTFVPEDADSVLTSYLRLVRRLRGAESAPAISLRRDDVDRLAEYLDEPGESVVERLGALMGATQVQRRAMVAMFVAGAAVIGLGGMAAAAATIDSGSGPAGTSTGSGGAVVATVDAPSSAVASSDGTGATTITVVVRSDGSLTSVAAAADASTVDAANDGGATPDAGAPAAPATAPVDVPEGARPPGASGELPQSPTVRGARTSNASSAGTSTAGGTATAGPATTAAPAAAPPVAPATVSTTAPPSGDAASRDAGVATAAQAAADADVARLQAELAAAQAKADRVAAEAAAAQATGA